MNYLFSIHPTHAKKIFDGTKTVELRSRRIQLNLPARLWIYVTTPVKHLAGYATITSIDHCTAENIWRRHGRKMGISKSEFTSYIDGRSSASAILIDDVVEFESPLDLKRLRQLIPTFPPPQFYLNMTVQEGLTDIVSREIGVACA